MDFLLCVKFFRLFFEKNELEKGLRFLIDVCYFWILRKIKDFLVKKEKFLVTTCLHWERTRCCIIPVTGFVLLRSLSFQAWLLQKFDISRVALGFHEKKEDQRVSIRNSTYASLFSRVSQWGETSNTLGKEEAMMESCRFIELSVSIFWFASTHSYIKLERWRVAN